MDVALLHAHKSRKPETHAQASVGDLSPLLLREREEDSMDHRVGTTTDA